MGTPNSSWSDFGRDLQVLREAGDVVVYRGWRGDDAERTAVLVVAPALDPPTPGSLERLAHEYELKDELDRGWAARPLDMVRTHGRTLLVLEDPGGEPLDRLLGGPMEVGRFLRLAVAVAEALAEAHRRGLVHKDIKPAHILVDEAAGAAWLTGFGIASRLPREHPAPEPPEVIAGTLAYLAPEQTGRMNRSVDSRSDLYALGVTFYQMLTGVLPFAAAEPMEWVHCHIARRPMPPAERVDGLPAVLSAIVMTCLAKTAEERYQTAAGVAADLRRCLEEWQAGGRIEPFVPAMRDAPDVLRAPEKLYGREREVGALLAAFERVVSSGRPELVLVSGYSGIGKSSVVNELHKAIVPSRGLFAAGKFDQYKRNIPYAPLAQALRTLVRQLLGKSDAEVSHWRDALQTAVGSHGQLIVDLVPELEIIIGKQPEAPDLPPQDALRHFQRIFRQFLGAFARAEHPLVLFLDDLQWLDAATLHLLEHLIAEPQWGHLLLVGAYRSNEVDPTHPLMLRLEAIRKAGAAVREIVLTNLSVQDLGEMVADALRCTGERAAPLAALLHQKTAGNPFFAIQFLTALCEEGVLSFEPRAAAWTWDIERIHAKGYTDNVVDLMAGKLTRLSETTQEALRQLACLGNAADLATLAMVRGETAEATGQALWEACRAGLVFCRADTCMFLHDRVQEAAYSLIPEAARTSLHQRIGRLLLAHTAPAELEDRLFEIVNQLDRGAELIVLREERERLAELNLAAARRAKAATAYASALGFLTVGCGLLDEDSWQRRYELIFALALQRAECEYLTGQTAAAEERLAMLARRAATLVDAAAVASVQIALYTTLARPDRSIAAVIDYLRRLGIEWSPHPTADEVRREYDRLWRRLGSRAIEDLIDLPRMTDPQWRATMEVLNWAFSPARFTDTNLLCLIGARMANLSLKYGNSDASGLAYLALGTVLGPRFGDYRTGFRFGKLGFDLVEKCGLQRFKAQTYFSFGVLISPWTRHVGASIELVRRAFDVAQESGNLAYASYSCFCLITLRLAEGVPLAEVQQDAERLQGVVEKAGFGLVADIIRGQSRLIGRLRGLTSAELEEAGFEQHLERDPRLAIAAGTYWIRKLQACFFAGDHAGAIAAAARAEPLLWTLLSCFEVAEFHFYAALASAANWEATPDGEREDSLRALAAHHHQLSIWAENCPQNFQDRVALVAAEIARIEGRDLEAMRRYEEAIASARDHGFIHNEALAYELAATFYRARGVAESARLYLRQARAGYARWGADGKVKQLDRRHPRLAVPEPQLQTATIGAPVDNLDVTTVVKASQALSGEIELPKLIEALMTIALQNAGADRGLLILPCGDAFCIEAEARASGDTVAVALRRAAMAGTACPETVLRYVIRTRESVILDDASRPGLFAEDAYLRRRPPSSVFCLPLVRQAKLAGALYLENTQATHAFTPDRIAVLELLAAQAAISLENTRLYGDLKEREARIRRLVDANIIGILIWDLEGGVREANDAFLAMTGYSREDLIAGRIRWNDMTPAEWRAADQQAVEQIKTAGTCRPFEKEYIRKDGSRVPVLLGGALFAGSQHEGVAFVLDLTERKQAEERQRLLVDELNHRVKNTLATVMAISAQTFRTAESPEAFRQAFEGRLLALSQTHNLLNRSCWTWVSLRDVLAQELEPYAEAEDGRFLLSGEEVRLGPVAAVTLGMAFHELATNAAKYGALSVPTGHVRVLWQPDAQGRLHLDWQEDGGPPVQPPRRYGFGSRLIERSLARELQGKVRLDFTPKGVHCTMDMALHRVCVH